MPGRDIIVVGASAGGVEALKVLVAGLPADLPAAVFVVLHVPSDGVSILPRILSRNGPLPAEHPPDHAPIVPGRIYVAPPDRHLVVRQGEVGLVRGPRENGHRPAVDALFRTAARTFGPRVVGVVLSGALDDGTAGLAAIKRQGGYAIVQDPAEALFRGMPANAMGMVEVDQVLPVAAIGPALDLLSREPMPDDPPADDALEQEADMVEFRMDAIEGAHPGTPSRFGCPDCGGVLWEVREGDLIRFRCRVGHAWSGQSLLEMQGHALEEALWVAMRALEERAELAGRLAERLVGRGSVSLARRYGEQRAECSRQADMIRTILQNPPDASDGNGEDASGGPSAGDDEPTGAAG